MSSVLQTPQRARRENEVRDINRIRAIRIGLASPEEIREKSNGEIRNPETIDYKTHKPKFDGLFCERIFGPTRDYECNCGKFRGIKHKGVTCDRCGVEVIQSKVRRSRLGHIHLEMPVAHIWFSKGVPSRLAALIDMPTRDLEKVLYYEKYLVVNPGHSPNYKGWEILLDLKPPEVIEEEEYGDVVAEGALPMMGAEAIKEYLKQINLEALKEKLEETITETRSQQKRLKAIKRLKIVQDFLASGNKPEWMIMEELPVIPPDLRPLVPLDGGRFATSDLNDLYRRVINRNNRLRRLKEVNAPEVIIRNEKRMLQEAVDALLDNGRRGRPVKGSNNRPLKSLSDMLKGKGGRFRQNLLGKRVDYSGRSVIVCGPNLKFHQCGLPKKMALELFEPFIIHHLERLGYVNTIRSAKRMIEREHPIVYDVLEKVIADHPVLLNRAPTLHRLGIQAFMPVLVEGNAIQLHPLTCEAFNADFDGDQMAVHVPLSRPAQLEAKALMLSSKNMLRPSNGQPIANPSQDIVLGCYYLTKEDPTLTRKEPRRFSSPLHALQAYDHGLIKLQELIDVRFTTHEEIEIIGEDPETGAPVAQSLGMRMFMMEEPHWGCDLDANQMPEYERDLIVHKVEFIRTTMGRIFFNEILAPELRFVNQLMIKKNLSGLLGRSFNEIGLTRTAMIADRIKDIGFEYAKKSGISIALSDFVVPKSKPELLEKARDRVEGFQKQFDSGATTETERYNKVIDCWIQTTEKISDELMNTLEQDQHGFNPVFMMKDSGARGSKQQIHQLSGMRGLMNKPMKKMTGSVGEIIESPIESNFKEGLTVLEYFISTHGARKGLADTALKTAEAGYLTRRLVDVAQDAIVIEKDCGTISGMEVAAIVEGDQVIESLRDRILGRCSLETIKNPLLPDRVLIPKGKTLDEKDVETIYNCGFSNKYPIRSIKVTSKSNRRTAQPEEIDLSQVNWMELSIPQHIYDLLVGRETAAPVLDTYNIIVEASDEINEFTAEEIVQCGFKKVKLRSVLCCETPRGVCATCYGRDLARGEMVRMGEAVGVIAAQSIGEPGTQLTLRTFHIGGTTSRIVSESVCFANLKQGEGGAVRFINMDAESKGEKSVCVGRNGKIVVMLASQKAQTKGKIKLSDAKHYIEDRDNRLVAVDASASLTILNSRQEVQETIKIPYGSRLAQGLKDGKKIDVGELVFERRPWSRPVVASHPGKLVLQSIRNANDPNNVPGRDASIDKSILRVVDKDEKVLEEHLLTPRTTVLLSEGDEVLPGDCLADIPLPVISEFEGKVRYQGILEGRTVQKQMDPVSGNLKTVVTAFDEHNIPRIAIIGGKGETLTTYHLPVGCEIRVKDNQTVFTGDILAQSDYLRQVEVVQVGSMIEVKDGDMIENVDGKRPALASWDPYQIPIIATDSGTVRYQDIEFGVTVRQGRDVEGLKDDPEAQGQLIVMEQKEDKHPCLEIVRPGKHPEGQEIIESLPSGAHIVVRDGQTVERGDTLARIPRESFKSRDVTGGLPRVEEVFEARRPKPRDLAIIARVSGYVRIPRPGRSLEEQPILDKLGKKRRRGTRLMAIAESLGTEAAILEAYEVDIGKHLICNDGDWVNVGDKLVDGSIDPHEFLEVMGEKRCMEYLLNEIQEVYRLQGVSINDKHIEVIIRQMMGKVTVTDPGNTEFLPTDQVPRYQLIQANKKVQDAGGQPARFQPNLLGITKASLGTESFISAASFQETTRVLTAAAIAGKEDELVGLKENVIMGRLIPAGTGKPEYYEDRQEELRLAEAPIDYDDTVVDAPADLAEALDQGVYNASEFDNISDSLGDED